MQTRTYKITNDDLPDGPDPYKTLLDNAYAGDPSLAGFELKAAFWDNAKYGQNDIPALIIILQKP